jgi:hypothetical protein
VITELRRSVTQAVRVGQLSVSPPSMVMMWPVT